MDLVQLGSSSFLNEALRDCFKVRKVYSMRALIEEEVKIKNQGVILIFPKTQLADYNLSLIDAEFVVLVSSVAVHVTSYSSRKFQVYRRFKSALERDVSEYYRNVLIKRFGMFVYGKKPWSFLHFFIVYCLRVFVNKDRVFLYTMTSTLSDLMSDKHEIVEAVHGKGWIKIKSRKFKRILARAYVKYNGCGA